MLWLATDFCVWNVMNNASLRWILITFNVTLGSLVHLLNILKGSRQRGCKTIVFVSVRLTCVSYVEQNGAGREAEVGDVGAELKPLQTRGGIKDNDIFILCESCTQKGWKIVYYLTHNALIHCNNNYYSAVKMPGKKKHIHHSLCDFKLKPAL